MKTAPKYTLDDLQERQLHKLLKEPLSYRGSCPCGAGNYGYDRNTARHANWHLKWAQGVKLPYQLGLGEVVRIPTYAPAVETKVAYTMAMLMQRECGYDFALFHGGDKSLERPTAYLACWQGWAIAIGVINVRPRWGYWHIRNEKDAIPLDQITPIVSLTGIFVCANYRGKGVAEFLIREIAKIEETPIEEMAYEMPFSESGKKMILSIIPEDTLRIC